MSRRRFSSKILVLASVFLVSLFLSVVLVKIISNNNARVFANNCIPDHGSCTATDNSCDSGCEQVNNCWAFKCSFGSQTTVTNCATVGLARAAVGGNCGGFVASCPGTCTNSTCAANGTSNCNDFNGHQDWCTGTGSWPWASTCSWDSGTGSCNGKYCGGEANVPIRQQATCASTSSGGYNASRDLCVASGCHYTPSPNTCAASSPCSNGTCQNQCGDTEICGPAFSYTAISPIGTAGSVAPDFSWSMYNPSAGSNVQLWLGSNCWLQGKEEDMYAGTFGPNTFSTPLSSFSCTYKAGTTCLSNVALSPSTAYSWQVYGMAPDGSYPGSGCINFTTPAGGTCTVSISPSSTTVMTGQGKAVTANVSNLSGGATVSSVTWTSANPAVASIASPGTSTTVTGVSNGSTTITATANLAPSGSCVSSPANVTTVTSYFQTYGGDLTAKGVIRDHNLPAGSFISGSSLITTNPNGQSCTTDNQCTSGHCADGVCCNTACTGSTCQRCDSYSSAGAGTCGYVSSQVDPDNECTAGSNSCSGNNVVAGASGTCTGTSYACATGGSVLQTCATASTCQTGGGCSSGACVAVSYTAPNTQGTNCTAAHYRCNGSGTCVAATINPTCTYAYPNYGGTTCDAVCASSFGSNNAGCINVWWGPPYDYSCTYHASGWACGTFGTGGVDCKCNVYSY